MKAVELREAGASIAIVGEDHWQRMLFGWGCFVFGALERQPFVWVSRSSLVLTDSSRAGSLPQILVCGQKVEVPETTKPSYFYEGFVLYGAAPRVEKHHNYM